MAIDPSRFYLHNVIDTCSVWNLLSSNYFYSTACSAGCMFCCTEFVYYECLHKPRKSFTEESIDLQNRFRDESEKGRFPKYSLDIEDLLEIEVLENRRKLSKGELSSIAFAKKTRQAFLTDDQNARKLAEEVMEPKMAQTVPHLFGWLFFTYRLSDGDKDLIIDEHKKMKLILAEYLEEMYLRALNYRLQVKNDESD